ncbi:MAG: class I SAM-dependent methyltransferase [Actinomycetota bacterium]
MPAGAVHPAARGFDSSADAYERGRPTYPRAAADELVARLGLAPGCSVVDVAAGTGKLTRSLVGRGLRVVAVEPSGPMRDQLRAWAGSEVEVLHGVAEALPVPSGSVDALVAGQAFHWFDGQRALAEAHRVLRPGGGLGLLWNVRDRSVGWVDRLAEMTEPYRVGVPTYRDGRWRAAFEHTALFTPIEHLRFPHEHEVDAATLVDRMASISWIANLPHGEREDLLARVRDLVAGLGDRFPVPYYTDLWWCRSLPDVPASRAG